MNPRVLSPITQVITKCQPRTVVLKGSPQPAAPASPELVIEMSTPEPLNQMFWGWDPPLVF